VEEALVHLFSTKLVLEDHQMDARILDAFIILGLNRDCVGTSSVCS
jgi:hypothetical protein